MSFYEYAEALAKSTNSLIRWDDETYTTCFLIEKQKDGKPSSSVWGTKLSFDGHCVTAKVHGKTYKPVPLKGVTV